MLSTDGFVAPVAATLHPSQLIPANQNACTFSNGPNRVACVAVAAGANMSSIIIPDGIPNIPT